MNYMAFLVLLSAAMGAVGLAAFLWVLRSGQYDDLEGDAARILIDDDDQPKKDTPITAKRPTAPVGK